MNKRLTDIARALNAVEHAMRIVGFGHNALMNNLKGAQRWLKAAKRATLGGNLSLSDLQLGNAESHLKLVLAQIDHAVAQ